MQANALINKIILTFAIISFLALFGALSALNGWFFYDIGLKIPLGDHFNMAIPFAVMGIAISFTASILSVTRGKLALIVGFAFHLVSVGVTYTSINFALDSQFLGADKVAQQIEIIKNQQELKEQQINSAKSGAMNQDQAALMTEREAKLDVLKATIAHNSKGVEVGTVWGKTQGCTANNWYKKTYASVCDDIKNTAANYAAKIESAAKVQENLGGASLLLDEQAKLVSKQVARVELPRITDDETLNKQYVTLTIAILFDVALVMLEWLLSGKIGAKSIEKQAANSRLKSANCPPENKFLADTVFSGFRGLIAMHKTWALLKRKKQRIKRLEVEKKEAELEAIKVKRELNSMDTATGREAMRNITGFNIMRIFKENNKPIGTETADIIALICRTYSTGDLLPRNKVHAAVNDLPELKESGLRVGRDKIEGAIKQMYGVLADEAKNGTTYKWLPEPILFDTIGKIRIAVA
jgi:hypothetical protein